MPLESAKFMLKPLLSNPPPSWGEVSSTKSLASEIVEIFGLVPSSAFAYAITVLPFATVAEVPVPVTYLNTTFCEPEVAFYKK